MSCIAVFSFIGAYAEELDVTVPDIFQSGKLYMTNDTDNSTVQYAFYTSSNVKNNDNTFHAFSIYDVHRKKFKVTDGLAKY